MLSIRIVEAKNLPIGDIKSSDPYVKVFGITNYGLFYFGKTDYKDSTLCPKWNQEIYFPAVCAEKLLLEIYDYNFFFADDYLAKVEIPITKLFEGEDEEEVDYNKKPTGFIKFTRKNDQYGTSLLELPIQTIQASTQERTITVQGLIPIEKNLEQKKGQNIDRCIVYHEAKTFYPKLKVRELDQYNNPLDTSKYNYYNGLIRTRKSFSSSFLINLNRLQSNEEKLQFYLECFQDSKFPDGTDETKSYLTFVGLPNAKSKELTYDGILTQDITKSMPFFMETPDPVMSARNIFCYVGRVWHMDKAGTPYESRYTKLEREIRSASKDQYNYIYKQLSQLVGSVFSNLHTNDAQQHRADLALLCEQLYNKLVFEKEDFKHEIKSLIRTKMILLSE